MSAAHHKSNLGLEIQYIAQKRVLMAGYRQPSWVCKYGKVTKNDL